MGHEPGRYVTPRQPVRQGVVLRGNVVCRNFYRCVVFDALNSRDECANLGVIWAAIREPSDCICVIRVEVDDCTRKT